jgi:adenylate kinase
MLSGAGARPGRRVTAPLSLGIGGASMSERIASRFTSATSGEGDHDDFRRPSSPGASDNCRGTAFIRRADDNAETARGRLRAHHAQTAPLITHGDLGGKRPHRRRRDGMKGSVVQGVRPGRQGSTYRE